MTARRQKAAATVLRLPMLLLGAIAEASTNSLLQLKHCKTPNLPRFKYNLTKIFSLNHPLSANAYCALLTNMGKSLQRHEKTHWSQSPWAGRPDPLWTRKKLLPIEILRPVLVEGAQKGSWVCWNPKDLDPCVNLTCWPFHENRLLGDKRFSGACCCCCFGTAEFNDVVKGVCCSGCSGPKSPNKLYEPRKIYSAIVVGFSH